jgi:hypothetical protein
MAKSADMQWIPSGTVLVLAAVAGLVAAILVNVYIGYVRADYEDGQVAFLQLKNKVDTGNKILERDLDSKYIPKGLVPAFESAKIMKADATGKLVIGQKAPRNYAAGEFLFTADFNHEPGGDVPIPPGWELMNVPVSQDSGMPQLQVGGYIKLRGRFNDTYDDRNPNIQPHNVVDCIQVKLINGSGESRTEKSRPPETIGILIRGSMAMQMDQVVNLLRPKGFLLTAVSQPEIGAEPAFNADILAYLNSARKVVPLTKGSTPPATTPGTPPGILPPVVPTTPPPSTSPVIPPPIDE